MTQAPNGYVQLIADIFGVSLHQVVVRTDDWSAIDKIVTREPRWPRFMDVIRRLYLAAPTVRRQSDVASELGLSRGRICQMKAKGLRILRHPTRSVHLRRFVPRYGEDDGETDAKA